MKKLTLMIAVFVLTGLSVLLAQTVVITGTVSSSVAGEGPIPGVAVLVKGTTIGASTDSNGRYSLAVPTTATTLEFQFIGMETVEEPIGGRTVINISMKPDVLSLAEVVVTSGYGIVRTPKGSSAMTQIVTGDKLNEVRQTNVNNALAGKVAGIQVRSQSAMKLSSTGEIRLRGTDGFGTGSGIIYVVDGTIITNSNDINMDEVEDINVLSGPAASAILGEQGANGAIIITTKKAKNYGRGLGVEVNIGFQAQTPSVLMNYQNSYAGGASGDLMKFTYNPAVHPEHWASLDGKYYHDYADDSSWGPRMVGQEYIPWYSWYEGTKYTGTTAQLNPQPNNARDFYELGKVWNNSIAFSQSTDKLNLRVVLADIAVQGLLPTTSMDKNSLSVRTDFKLNDRWTVGANVNFNTTFTNGEFNDGYSNQSTGSFNQWFHRNLDMDIMKELRGMRTPGGIYGSWNHRNPAAYNAADEKMFYAGNYWYNNYTWFDLIDLPSRSDRLFGDLSLSYQIIEGLKAKVTYRRQTLSFWNEEKYSTDLNDSGTQTTGNEPKAKGYYYSYTQYTTRENYETLLSYQKKIGDIAINANAGTDLFRYINKSNRANTVDGFNVPNLFTIANSKSQASIGNGRSAYAYNAAFVRADVGFRDFLFAEFTLRNDWYSQLPSDNNSILSKSFGGAFVFSDLLKIPALSFGKLRYAWGEIPTSLGAYQYPGFAYGVGQYQWNGNFLMGTPDQLVDPKIRGAVKTQKEIGLELRFLDDRFGLTTTYWDGTVNDMPYSVSVSPYSGFTSKLINTGSIVKQGIDLVVNMKPIRTSNFSWEINATWAYLLKNEVVEIAEGIDRLTVQTYWGTTAPYMVHAVGQPWGMIYGNGILRNPEGKPILTTAGAYRNDPGVYFGNVLPKFTGGIQNSIRFLNNFTLVANIDFQSGGKFYSLSDTWGSFSGLTAKTGALNDKGIPVRDPVGDGGGVRVDGVFDIQDYVEHPDGDPIWEDRTYYVEAAAYYQGLYNNKTLDEYVYDLTYVKLREISFGYNIPTSKIGFLSNYVSSARFSLVANNLWLIYATTRDFDPSEISAAGGETGQMPSVRSYGANLRITF
jgi:TonB-linked SusC/RagA family outer membrane protein